MPSPVDVARERTCVRCDERFRERAGQVTRVCDRCRHRGTPVLSSVAGETLVDRRRERTCIRCGDAFTEESGEISRLCPNCDSAHRRPDYR